LRSGYFVAIVGYPNSGKSTLFNTLLKRNRAIVSEVPGTTRDYLEEYIYLDAMPIKLIDTAGIRQTTDIIEIEGIKFVQSLLEQSNMILVLNDASISLNNSNNLYNKLNTTYKSSKTVLIQNKIDKIENIGNFENKENENEKLFFGTDIGKINDEIQKYINEAEILFIETNYDKSLVEKSPRYYKHKNWLFSEKGHLSNDDTASAIRNGLIARSGRPYKKIILAHLSRTCNTPELAKNAVIREVKEFNQPKESILTAPAKDILILKNFDLFLN